MADLIEAADLVEVPGVTGTETDLAYAARRASSSVMSAWCRPVDPVPGWVRDIAVDIAARYLRNPRGTTSVTRHVDDASRTERFAEKGTVLPGTFDPTEDELAKLCPKARRRLGSIRLSVPGYQP